MTDKETLATQLCNLLGCEEDDIRNKVDDILLIVGNFQSLKAKANCDRNDCRYYKRQIEFAEKCKECLENCVRTHLEGFNHFEQRET